MTTVTAEKPWTQSTHRLRTSDGTGDGRDVDWKVVVRLGHGGRITREVCMDDDRWIAETREWCPELTIWPTWSPAGIGEDGGESPLQGVHDYWSASDDRLRDSAKWMAALVAVRQFQGLPSSLEDRGRDAAGPLPSVRGEVPDQPAAVDDHRGGHADRSRARGGRRRGRRRVREDPAGAGGPDGAAPGATGGRGPGRDDR